MTDMKRCPACPDGEQWHPATPEFFGRNKSRKDGLQTHCKVCRSKRAKRDNARPEIRARSQARWQSYINQPGKREHHNAKNVKRLRGLRYDPETRESVLVHDKDYRDRPEVREQRHANWKSWSSQNREHRRTYVKTRYAQTEVRERRRAYQANREARKKAIAGNHTATQIQEQLKRQYYRCYYAACGFSKFPKVDGQYIYHVDHTFPVSRIVGSDIPANDISYLVLACQSCNESKGNKYPWEWAEGGKLL